MEPYASVLTYITTKLRFLALLKSTFAHCCNMRLLRQSNVHLQDQSQILTSVSNLWAHNHVKQNCCVNDMTPIMFVE